MKKQKQINVRAYKAAGFIGQYQKLVSETVIPYQHSVLYDMAPDTEKSGRATQSLGPELIIRGSKKRRAQSAIHCPNIFPEIR